LLVRIVLSVCRFSMDSADWRYINLYGLGIAFVQP